MMPTNWLFIPCNNAQSLSTSKWHLRKETASHGASHVCFTFRTTCRNHRNWLRGQVMTELCWKNEKNNWMLSAANQERGYDTNNRSELGFIATKDPPNWERNKDWLVIFACSSLYSEDASLQLWHWPASCNFGMSGPATQRRFMLMPCSLNALSEAVTLHHGHIPFKHKAIPFARDIHLLYF